MKQFRNYIIYNCNCRASDYADYFLTYINSKLFYEIVILFDLDETMLIENELFI